MGGIWGFLLNILIFPPTRSTEQRLQPLELEAELEDFSQKNNALEAVVERLKGAWRGKLGQKPVIS